MRSWAKRKVWVDLFLCLFFLGGVYYSVNLPRLLRTARCLGVESFVAGPKYMQTWVRLTFAYTFQPNQSICKLEFEQFWNSWTPSFGPRLFSINFWRFQKNAKSLKPPLGFRLAVPTCLPRSFRMRPGLPSMAAWRPCPRARPISAACTACSARRRAWQGRCGSCARRIRSWRCLQQKSFAPKPWRRFFGEFWGGECWEEKLGKNCMHIFAPHFEVGEYCG